MPKEVESEEKHLGYEKETRMHLASDDEPWENKELFSNQSNSWHPSNQVAQYIG